MTALEKVRVGFMMDQVAGHVTNYKNLRAIADTVADIDARWSEVVYYEQGGRIERFRERLVPFVPTYFTGNLRGAVELRRGLRRGGYDVVFSNSSAGVFFGRRFARIPTLVDFDATPLQLDAMPAYTPRPDPRAIATIKFRLFRHMLESSTVLHSWSRWAAASAISDYGIPPHRVVVNPPGVDTQLWAPPADASSRRCGDVKRILFVGADFRRKGGDLLLDWFVSRRPDKTELHVVTRESVEPREGVVVHHGLTPNSPELLALYHSSDVFVLPSLGECFGIATIEAMAAGLPVVISDVGAAADLVDEGVNGHVVGAGDGHGLGAALTALVSNDERRRSMGAAARRIAESKFEVNRNARRTLSYLQVIGSWTPQQRERWMSGTGDLSDMTASLQEAAST